MGKSKGMEKRGEKTKNKKTKKKTLREGSSSKEQMARDLLHSIPTNNPSLSLYIYIYI